MVRQLNKERNVLVDRELITPEIAEKYLGTNQGNRSLRQAKVDGYARDMTAGRWVFNGDAIRFDYHGVLIDGQHRLWAVIESGVTMDTLVVRGLPTDTRDTVDVGATRTARDGLKFRGVEHFGAVAPIARRLVLWERNVRALGGAMSVTHPEIYAFVEDHPEVQFAAEVAIRARKSIPCSPTAVGVAYYLASHIDHAAAEIFFIEQLIEKLGLRFDDPARALLRRLETASAGASRGIGMSARINEDDALRYLILAWNAFREGKRLTKLQAPKGGWGRKYPEIK